MLCAKYSLILNMTYYHYTTLNAFSGILQDNPIKNKEICFWATRIDCFVDKTEYIHGIDKLRPVIEKFELQTGLQEDSRISQFFNPKDVESALGLPVPYVISISARKDNEYMWRNYADNWQGVVLEVEFENQIGFYEAALYSIESCLYDSNISSEELAELVKAKYLEMAGIMLGGNKELAIALLRDNPKVFVMFIAMYLLAFVAPRFKKDEFVREEETRIIIASPKKEYNSLFDNVQCPVGLEAMVNEVRKFVDCEKQRPDNDKFFREIFMPISVLKRIHVKKDEQKQAVEAILRKKGFNHIIVEVMN